MFALLLPKFLVLAGLFLMLGWTTAIQEPTALLTRDAGAICSTYIVAGGDTCTKIAQTHGIAVKNIEDYNAQIWAWHGCAQLQQGAFICLSSGEPPIPVALPNAICGPQVPGTVRPKKYSDLASLNPCPGSQCCSKLGQCGTTSAFCSAASGCISHCKEGADTQPAHNSAATVSATSTKDTTTSTKSTTSSKFTTTKHLTTTASKTSKTTTVAATSAGSHWQLTMYSKKNCEGDYYLLQGYNSALNQCLQLQSGLSTIVSETGVSCRWWVDGGFSWKSCDASDMKKPRSWFMNNGSCLVYSDSACKEYSGTINGGTHIGCQSEHTMGTGPDTDFGSLKCAQLAPLV